MRRTVPILALALAAGCDNLASGYPEDTIPAASKFTVSIFETHSSVYDPSVFYLRVQEDGVQHNCANFQLGGGITQDGARLAVTLDGSVGVPTICLAALGPALLTDDVDLADGSYELTLSLAGRGTDRFDVVVADTNLTITPVEATFTRAEHTPYGFPRRQPLPPELQTPEPSCASPAPLRHSQLQAPFVTSLPPGVNAHEVVAGWAERHGFEDYHVWVPSSGGAHSYIEIREPLAPATIAALRCEPQMTTLYRDLP
jgi:hypothetical protein